MLLLGAGVVALLVARAAGGGGAVVPIAFGQLIVLVALSAPMAWSQEERLRRTGPPVVWPDRDEFTRRQVSSMAGAVPILGGGVWLIAAAAPDIAIVVGVPLVWGGLFGLLFVRRLRRIEATTGHTAVVEARRPRRTRRRWFLTTTPCPWAPPDHMATAPASTGKATPVT